jgi:hypothetical protein
MEKSQQVQQKNSSFIRNKVHAFRRGQFRRIMYTRDLEKLGYEIKQLSENSFVVNGRLEIYPSKKTYKDLKNGQVGKIENMSFRQFILHFYNNLA